MRLKVFLVLVLVFSRVKLMYCNGHAQRAIKTNKHTPRDTRSHTKKKRVRKRRSVNTYRRGQANIDRNKAKVKQVKTKINTKHTHTQPKQLEIDLDE